MTRLLVVDDDPDTRTLVRRALGLEIVNAEIDEATDLIDLKRLLGGPPVDVLVTDFDLRWSDGFDVLSEVRGVYPDCVAIMFTGTGNEDLAVRAIKAGFDDYVVKAPGQFRRLGNSAKHAFARHEEKRLLRDNRELLRKELYHRLHNNLQLVLSLMQLTMRAIDDEKGKKELHELSRRIQSLSVLQEQLYRAEDLRSVDVGQFVRQLIQQVRSEQGDIIEANVAPVIIAIDKAAPAALIISELVMNAIDAVAAGNRVEIELSRVAGQAIFTIEGGVNKPSSNLSVHLTDRLAHQIDAKITRGQSDQMITRVVFDA